MGLTRKQLKIIEDHIAPYGYRIVHAGGHNKIVDAEGKFLVSFSGSPSKPHWYKNVIADLKRYGHTK